MPGRPSVGLSSRKGLILKLLCICGKKFNVGGGSGLIIRSSVKGKKAASSGFSGVFGLKSAP